MTHAQYLQLLSGELSIRKRTARKSLTHVHLNNTILLIPLLVKQQILPAARLHKGQLQCTHRC